MVELALELGAKRVEIAHVQYYGWALKNRGQLMPTREQVDRAVAAVERLRAEHKAPDRDRRGRAGLLRALSQGLRRRLGAAFAQRDAVRQGAAVPRRREHSGPRFLERARALARRHLGQFAGVHGVSRHRLDAGAVSLVLEAERGFRRLPLPGLRDDRRRAGDRSGVLPVAAPREGGGTGAGRVEADYEYRR